MTTAFKAGDKVEYVKDHDGRKAGTKATVKSVGIDLITVEDEYGKDNMIFPYRVKPVSATEFKVGDKVELLMDYMWANKGDVLTVIDPSRHGNPYLEHDATGKHMGGFSHRFKLIEATPTFKVGDRVRITATDWQGRTGTVTNPHRGTSLWPVEVEVDGAGNGIYDAHELEHITEPEAEEVKTFNYADIQKGDKIRRTKTYPSGSVEVREGVVTYPADGGYWSDGAFILAYDSDAFKSSVTLELLERPEPVKTPEETLVDGAKIGTEILLDLKNGVRKLYTKEAEDTWTTLVIKPYGVHKGFDWTDARMKVNLKDRDTKLVTR